MVQTAHSLDPVNPNNLMSIDPINWRRYPSVPITKAMTDRIDIPAVAYTGGAASVGAASDNNGETGTMNTTNPLSGQGWWTQADKAVAMGTVIAPDIGKSYAGSRGLIEADQPYPTTVIPTTVTPAAFLPSNFIPPVQGP